MGWIGELWLGKGERTKGEPQAFGLREKKGGWCPLTEILGLDGILSVDHGSGRWRHLQNAAFWPNDDM